MIIRDSNKDQSDEQLVKAAIRNDPEALKLLVERYMSLVYSISRRYLRQTEDAEDATQETFVKMWRNLKKIDLEKPLKPWIGEIAKNTCLDLLKKKHALPFAAFTKADGSNSLNDTISDAALLPSEMAEQSLSKRLLETAIQKLPSDYAKIIALYYTEGLNFREIGERFNESINTIKSRHRRALFILRKIIPIP